MVLDVKTSFLSQALFFFDFNLWPPPSWTAVRRPMAKTLHRTHLQHLSPCFKNVLGSRNYFCFSPDLQELLSTILASVGSSTRKHVNVKRVLVAYVLVAALFLWLMDQQPLRGAQSSGCLCSSLFYSFRWFWYIWYKFFLSWGFYFIICFFSHWFFSINFLCSFSWSLSFFLLIFIFYRIWYICIVCCSCDEFFFCWYVITLLCFTPASLQTSRPSQRRFDQTVR